MSRISDITNAAIRSMVGTFNSVKAVLAINAAGAATVKTTNALSYVIDGIQYTKAALAAQAIAITSGLSYVQPALTTVYYTLGVDAAGNISVTQGSYAGQTLSADPTKGIGVSKMGASWVGDGSVPDVPDGYCPFGLMKVTTAAATTFTPGTTLLDAAGVTVAYYDLALLPSTKP